MLKQIKSLWLWVLMVVIAIFISCSPVPSFYLVVDDDVELANLTGKWEGEFTTSIPERYGSIFIMITATNDTAYGEVVLSWHDSYLPHIMEQDPNALDSYRKATKMIRIEEIFVKNGNVGGIIEPYREPKAGYLVRTKFRGRQSKDIMEGSFQSKVKETRESYKGKWKVTRRQDRLEVLN